MEHVHWKRFSRIASFDTFCRTYTINRTDQKLFWMQAALCEIYVKFSGVSEILKKSEDSRSLILQLCDGYTNIELNWRNDSIVISNQQTDHGE